MDPEKGDSRSARDSEVHPGWKYVKHTFPSSWDLKHAEGATSLLIPTSAEHEVRHHGIKTITTSRRTRKGRHPVVVSVSDERTVEHVRPRTLLHPFGYKLYGWAPRNISYWVALAFTIGSVSWIVNGCYAMWPLKNSTANLYAVGYTAVLGGGLFEVGSILAFLEYANRNRKKIDVGHKIEHEPDAVKVYHSKNDASYHTLEEAQPLNPIEKGRTDGNGVINQKAQNGNGESKSNGENGREFVKTGEKRERYRLWCWEPRSLAYWTVVSQLIGATIFGVPACITGVPNVLWTDYPPGHYVGWDILYWLPQVIGSCFFILNSYLTMIETQHAWFGFKPLDIGWEAGFWNLLGAFGFLFSGIFGFLEAPADYGQKWGTAFSTWWGSIFFLISSYLLIPEALNK